MITLKKLPAISASFACAFFHLCLYRYIDSFNNIIYFFALFLVFFSAYLLTDVLIKKYGKRDSNSKIEKIISVIVFAFFVLFVVLFYLRETHIPFFDVNYSLRHRINPFLYIIFLFVCSCLCYFLVYKWKSVTKVRMIFGLIICTIQSVVILAPNIMRDLGGNLFHIHAYFNPIYNASDFIPLSSVVKSIYGHYSFFYIIPMNILKLFGINKVYSAMIITFVVFFVSFALLYFALNNFIKYDFIYIISVLSISYISFYIFQSGQYYQILPHRIVFTCLLIFLFSLKREYFPWWIVVLFSSFAIIWNFETGIVCAIAFIAYNFLKLNMVKGFRVINLFYALMVFIISICTSYILVLIFNLLLGGDFISIKDFIFPIASDDYKISELSIKFPELFNFYFIEFFFFASILCYELIGLLSKKTVINDKLFCLSLLGMGLSPYYINRASYNNIAITHIVFVSAIVIFLGLCLERNVSIGIAKKLTINYVVLMVCVILSFFTIDSLLGIPMTLMNRINSSWNMNSYDVFLNEFNNRIPETAAAVGPGVPDVYYTLNRDPQIRVMDWSDWHCSETIIEYAVNQINMKNEVVFNNSTGVADYLNWEDWILVDYYCNEFYYIVKIDNSSHDREEFIIQYGKDRDYTLEQYIDLFFLDLYKTYPNDEIRSYYIDMYSEIQDISMMYEIMDYEYNEFTKGE